MQEKCVEKRASLSKSNFLCYSYSKPRNAWLAFRSRPAKGGDLGLNPRKGGIFPCANMN